MPVTWQSHQITTIPRPTSAIAAAAFTGVSPGGRDLPSHDGNSPERPPSKIILACELTAATRVQSTETMPDQPREDRGVAEVVVGHFQKWHRGTTDRSGVVVKAADRRVGEEDEKARS